MLEYMRRLKHLLVQNKKLSLAVAKSVHLVFLYKDRLMNASHWKINATKDFFLKKNLGIAKIYVILQRCHWVFKSGWATSNVVGIICPPGANRVN